MIIFAAEEILRFLCFGEDESKSKCWKKEVELGRYENLRPKTL